MAQQDGYGGFSPTAYGAPAPHVDPPLAAPPPAPLLRPLSTGEVLDRTFALYRRRFWLFAGIGAMPAAVLTLSSVLRLTYLAATHRFDTIHPGDSATAIANAMSTMVLMQAYFLPATVLFLVAYGISHAATVDAVSQITQGLDVTATAAYNRVRGRWLRWSGITLRQFWSAAWPMLPGVLMLFAVAIPQVRANKLLVAGIFLLVWLVMIGAVVWGVINYLRNSLAIPAGLQENLGVNAAIRRSKVLVAGRKGRIFLALLLVYALQMVAGGIQIPFVFMATAARGAEHILLQAIVLLVEFVSVTLVTPVASIALCLIYIDERVRREGYDIELLMQRSFNTIPVVETYVPPQSEA